MGIINIPMLKTSPELPILIQAALLILISVSK